MTPKQERFRAALERHYEDLFANDPEYSYSKARISPKELAEKMTQGFISGHADKGGTGTKRTCRELGIPHTYTGIREYLS